MQDFKIESTKKSPKVIFCESEKLMRIHGRSMMSNLDDDFYNPIFDILSALKVKKAPHFTIEFRLEYFNTSSHLSIIKILKKVDELKSVGTEPKIKWVYETDDVEMREIGEEIQRFCNTRFIFELAN